MTETSAVLIVDDNVVDRERVARMLGSGYARLEASTAAEGLEVAAHGEVGCVLLDYRLPDRDGDDAVADFLRLEVPVVMMTGQGSEAVAVRVMKRGATDYLVKGEMGSAGLRRVVGRAMENARLRRALAQQREAVEKRDQRLGFVLRQLPVVAWDVDPRGRLTSIAGAGLAEVSGADAQDLIGTPLDELEEPLRQLLQTPTGVETRDFVSLPRGRVHRRHVAPTPDGGLIGMAYDVTESRVAESQLRQATKMEALGQLAGGVAHDFNNILTAISSFATFARNALTPEQEEIRSDLAEVLEASRRAAELVGQLLAFSRRSAVTDDPTDLAATVQGALPMLERLVGEDVPIDLATDPEPWWVGVDASRIESILVNLVVNARDAMPRGGRIGVAISNVELTEAISRGKGGRLEPGDYVMLAVSDEGTGIAPEALERIFDPFFTTKDVDRGTGLGLSTVYGIARDAEGTVTVDTERDRGTTFRVYLPRAEEEAAEARDAPREPAPRGDGETVLLIEDDPQVRRAVERMLQSFGYRVHSVGGPVAAMQALDRVSIDVVLSDVVIPGTDGFSLAWRIKALVPSLPIVFISGYTDRVLRRRHSPGDVTILEKPIQEEQLAWALAQALEQARLWQPSPSQVPAPPRVLVVDDDPKIRRLLSRLLRGCTVTVAESGAEALALCETERFDLVISDDDMPGMDGCTLQAQLQQRHPETRRVLCSGRGHSPAIEEALATGAIERVVLKGPTLAEELGELVGQTRG